MDAFDNPARDGMTGPLRDSVSADQANQALSGGDLLAAAAVVTATASGIPLAIQGILVPDANGRIVLPAGVTVDDITVSGTDLIITLPNGQVLIIPNGAIDIPAIVVDGDTIPASTVAQLLENLDDLNPEAGVRSSGGNFADPEGAIQDPYALGDLLPYTELAFPVREEREVLPDLVPDEEVSVVIVTPDQPAGSTSATASVNEAGLPARGSEPAGSNSAANSETTTGSIVYDAPDGLAAITINGTAITTVGQVVTTPLGQLTITSLTPGNVGYSYVLTDNTNANNNPADIFDVVVIDSDGDSAPATLTISVLDDVPTARADTDAVAPATFTAESGNVITGVGTTSGNAGADTAGADGATLTGITAGTGTVFTAPGTSITGQYGTLTINASGGYSYVRNAGTPGGVNDVFTYRLTDGDGDVSTATLTIAIGDSPNTIDFVPGPGDSTIVDESQLPPRGDESEGSAFDGDPETTTGTITFTSPDGVASVTIEGVAITPGSLPQPIFSDATGTLVITGYTYDPATGTGSITYDYTLADNALNPGDTTVSFDVVVTDLDGDSATDTLDITIVDDVPAAVNDVDSVSEDGALIADGNVLTGVGGIDANATDGVADTRGADGATVTAVTGGSVGTAFTTAYGSLTLGADGSYSYVLDNMAQPVQGLSAGETLTESFTYTITDGDGDTATATLTITINGSDDGVTINGLDSEGWEQSVDEDDLADGSSPDAAALTQTGSFTVTTPDGLDDVTIGGVAVVTNGVFTPVTVISPLGTVNITGLTPVTGADGSVIGGTFTYAYVLSDNTLTHGASGSDSVIDSFAVVVTDSDGSAANASLDVRIVDDVPAAMNDVDSVSEDGALIADGNVLTGVGGIDANATDGAADTRGADGATVTAVTGGSVGTAFTTAYGSLTLGADGSYSYVLDNMAQPVQGLSAGETLTESFTYTITDGDGDTATATLTITINGSDDGVTINGLDGAGAELNFDEDDLPARSGEAAGSDATPESVVGGGNFAVSTPDGMGAVVLNSFNGAPIAPLTLVTSDGSFTPQTVATAYGTLSITGFTPVAGADGSVIGGSFTYSYTLTDNRGDHGVAGEDSLTDSIGVTVTDSDGSSASATIDIAITDDVPAASDDMLMQPVENQPVTINVLDNDTQGADSVQAATVQLVDGTLTGAGTLVNNGDGSFTYTQAPGEIGAVSFQYQITDGDGDTSVATATIMLVADSAPQIRNVDNVTVDEDGLPGANADNGLPGEVTSTGSAAASGAITVDFGGDVPTVLAGSLVLNDDDALDGQLTVDGVDVTFAKDGADLVGSVGGSEVIRITLTTATTGPGANEITYGYSVALSASIDQLVAGSEDSDILSGIGFTVTDNDGTPATGAFSVTVVDDLPTLTVSDTPTNAVEGGPAVTGSWSLDDGADGVESVLVSFGVGAATLALTPGGTVTIVQPTGALTVNADGSFSFLAAGNQNQTLNPAATFTLSAVDRDGDPTSDSLTIMIDDGAGPVGGDTLTLTVDEAAIDGIGRTPLSNNEVASGMLDFTAGTDTLSGFQFTGVAGLAANLDGAGTDIFWSMAPGGQTIIGSLTLGGPAAITISLSAPASVAPGATGSATVTVTLADNLPHELAMAAQTQALGTVTVQATDTDGDVATGVATIQVIDDIPVISGGAPAASALTVDDSDLTTNATANFGVGQPGSLFNVAFNADGPAASNSVVYTLGVSVAGAVSGLVDTATGQTVLLTNEAGVIVGRTSGSGDVVFTLSVDANGTVTLDQQRAVFHTPDSGPDQATGLSAADLITLTATITDSDGDQASATVNVGGALTFKDDGVSIDINVVNEAGILLTTQDAETIGPDSDIAVSTANFSGAFAFANADFGADDAGSISWNYALSLFGADGVSAQLASNGAPIFLYDVGGVITGSTAASVGAVNSGNTVFTLSTNATNGTVTLTQFAQIDHDAPGVDSNFATQIETLAANLVRLSGTVTITDRDGDTDSATQSIDLGGNVQFADDGPSLDVMLKAGAELRIDETNGVVATGTEVDPDSTGNLGTATIAIADLYTVNLDAGADAPASYSYAFVLGAAAPASGYLISSSNEVIRLYQTAPGTVEGRGETSGNVAFTFTVATNDTVTMTQFIAIEHGNTASNDETSPGMNAGALLLQVTATDFDGDFSRDTVDLGSIVRIEDDGPSISNVAGAGSVTLDETGGLDTNVISAAAVITANFNFGADGAASANSVVYGLTLTGDGTTSLTTAVGDFPISLVATGANQITGRYTDGGGVVRDAFTVAINANGTLTVSQLVALEHLQDGNTPLHNDALTLDGLITASVTITDSDGDSVSATKQVGGQVTFLDDGPSVTAVAAGAATVLNDESATSSIAPTIDTGAIVKGNDPHVGGVGAISVASSAAAVVTATPVYGADGAAASNALTYALTILNGGASGLSVTDGSPITLVQVGNVIVGQVVGGTFGGQAAFAIAIDPVSGAVTVEQYLSLDHPNAANPDDQLALLTGALGVVVTATDSDGDFANSNTVDISAQILFDDDGPAITNVAGGASVTLDETGGFDSVTSTTAVITADFAYGADGAAASGAVSYGIELTAGGTSIASGLATAVGDFPITLVEISASTIVGRYTDGGGVLRDAFTISINTDGQLTVTQLVALEHLQDGDTPLHNDPLTLTGLISATVTIKDGDDDTATAKTEVGDQITFLDDGPSISGLVAASGVTLDETGGFDSVTSAAAVVSGSFNFGTDGAAAANSIVYGIELTAGGSSGASGLATAVGDFPITLVETSATTIVGRYTDGGGVVRDAFTIAIGTDGKLTVTQLVALEHLQDGELALHNDSLSLSGLISARVTIADSDGDTASDVVQVGGQISFLDDGLTANPDTKSVTEGAVATGNVLTDNPDVFGVDGADATIPAGGVVGVRVAGGDTVTPVATGTGTLISTVYGDLTLNADGSYTYDAKPNTTAAPVNDVFVYTIRDADGDTSTTTLTITVQPVTLVADNDVVEVNEAGLDLVQDIGDVAPGSVVGSNPAATTESVSGTLAVTGSTGILYTPQTVEDALGKFVLNSNGTYTYSLKSALDGPTLDNGVTTTNMVREFTYTATDANGNSTTGTVTVNVVDDIPTARADTDSVTEDTAISATGNVTTGVGTTNAPGSADTAGADGSTVTGVVAGASAVPVAGNIGAPLVGAYGSLTLGSDGAYTYTLNNSLPAVQALGAGDTQTDTFTYTITDGDGDTSTTTLTITVNGNNDAPTVTNNAVWMSSDPLQQTASTPTFANGYPLNVIVPTDIDGDPLTVTAANTVAGVFYFNGTTYVALTAGTVLFSTTGGVNLLDDLVYRPTATANDIVDLTLNLNVSDGIATSVQSVFIHEVAPTRLPGQNVQIGDGNSPLTSGNDQIGGFTLNTDFATGLQGNLDIAVLEVFTDFQRAPFDLPIPADERDPTTFADNNNPGSAREREVTVEVRINGNRFVVVQDDDSAAQFEQSWFYDPATGLMKATVPYTSIFLLDGSGNPTTTTLADYLTANPPAGGDTWTVAYLDDGPGNFQARLVRFEFKYDDAGNPAITVNGDPVLADTIYGTSGNDTLSGNGGNDIIYGRGGNDVINGGDGNDTLFGNDGNDTITGGPGTDIIDGGTGTNTITPPLALDLDGDGVEFVSTAAGVHFDFDGDGVAEATAWVAPDDALLVYDANGDRMVTQASELVLTMHAADATTDLDALRLAFDSNADGVFDADDADYASFGVWQDANGNGITDAGEYRTLAEAGIVSINLTSDNQSYSAADGEVHVYGETSYQLSSGAIRAVADASFAQTAPTTLKAQDRPATAMPITDALVAASLITMVHAAQASETEPSGAVSDDVAFMTQDEGSVTLGTADDVSPAMVGGATQAAADSGTDSSVDSASPSISDANPATAAIDEARDSSWRSEEPVAGDEGSSEALFDFVSATPASAMDGLLTLGLAAAAEAAAQAASASATDPAAEAVLADVIDNGGLDHLIDAVTGAMDAAAADGAAPTIDLAQFLDVQVAGAMGTFTHTPIEQEMHQMASA